MELEPVSANAILLAQTFNPSIVTKDWMMSKVVSEEPTNFVNTPAVSIFETPRFQLVVDAARLQVVLKQFDAPAYELCSDIVSKYVERLPETPYTAIGFNFRWRVQFGSEESASAALKSLFMGDQSALECALETKEFSIGGIVYGTYEGAKLRLVAEPSPDRPGAVIFAYNYHHQATDPKAVIGIAKTFGDKVGHSKSVSERIVEVVHAYSA